MTKLANHNVGAERRPADQARNDIQARPVSGAKPKRRRKASGEEGRTDIDALPSSADLANSCAVLKQLQTRRRHLIRSKDRNRLALGSLVRAELGWSAALSETERKKIRDVASKLVADALGKKPLGEKFEWLEGYAGDIEASCLPFDERLAKVQKEMAALAGQLPVAEWVKAKERNGFGMPTLAVIVGETGDIGNYENPGKVWKRLGLAPKDTYPQADSGAYMVPRQRRAQIWASLGDSLLKAQTRKIKDADGKDTGERIALGKYGEEYLRKKAEYLERGWTKNHAHKAAHRYMEKRAIRDLWRAWRGQRNAETLLDDAPPPLLNAAE